MTWFLAALSAFAIGVSKGGLKGMSPIFVLLMAGAFGGKASTGIMVPLLLLGDVFGLYNYGKYIQKKYVYAFLPWVLVGVLIGVWIGKDLPEEIFKKWIAVSVLFSMVAMWVWNVYQKKEVKPNVFFTRFMGLGAGVFTMLGNLAGVFSNLYFLMTRIPKKELIGTSTIVFFIVNMAKIPFHVLVWETISLETLRIDLMLSVFVLLGFFVGVRIIDYVSEAWFRKFLYVVTVLGALQVLVG